MLATRNTPSSAINGRLRSGSTLVTISATAASRTRALDRYRGHWNSWENISRSFPVQVERVTSPFAVVGDVLHLVRRPVLEFEIVRHHPGAFLQLLIEHRLNFVDEARQQINRDQVRGTVVLLQQIPVDDMRVLFQVQFQDLVGAQLAQVLVQFHADAIGVELDKDLCKLSTDKILKLHLEKNAHIVNGDLLKQNYSSADLITVYL